MKYLCNRVGIKLSQPKYSLSGTISRHSSMKMKYRYYEEGGLLLDFLRPLRYTFKMLDYGRMKVFWRNLHSITPLVGVRQSISPMSIDLATSDLVNVHINHCLWCAPLLSSFYLPISKKICSKIAYKNKYPVHRS